MVSGAGNVSRGSKVLNAPCWAVQCQDEQQQDSPARKAAGFQDQWETGHWVCFLLPGGQCQLKGRQGGCPPQCPLATSFPSRLTPAPCTASAMPSCAQGPGQFGRDCVPLLFGHRLVRRWTGWLGRGTRGFKLCHTLQAVPHVPAGPGGEDPGHVCFPWTHGAQEVHKGWISHLQPRPWLSAGRQLFPSPWHRQALPLPIHLIKTTSLLWGSHVLHPSWAASFPESRARACRDQISLVQGLRVRASPLCFPLCWINLLGVDG